MTEKKVHSIEFLNPVFRWSRDGGLALNVTVRNGPKWSDKLSVGDEIEYTNHNGAYARSRVRGVLFCELADVPAGIHKMNHDPACRTVKGIAAELTKIYGPAPLGGRLVTVIFFQ